VFDLLQEDSSQETNELSHQHLEDIDSNAERDLLMHEKRQFYEQLVEFEDKKRALAETEFHLNKEVLHLICCVDVGYFNISFVLNAIDIVQVILFLCSCVAQSMHSLLLFLCSCVAQSMHSLFSCVCVLVLHNPCTLFSCLYIEPAQFFW